MANATQTVRTPASDVFPHPMLDDYGVEERSAMLRVRTFMERFLNRRPSVTEVVFDGFGMPDSGGTVQIVVGPITAVVELDEDTGVASVQ